MQKKGNHYFELISNLLSKLPSRKKCISTRKLINNKYTSNCTHELGKMLTAIIIVARVQPGTSKGITDLLLPPPYSGLKNVSGPSSFLLRQIFRRVFVLSIRSQKVSAYQQEKQQEVAVTFVAFVICIYKLNNGRNHSKVRSQSQA